MIYKFTKTMNSIKEIDENGLNFPLAGMLLWKNEGRKIRLRFQGKSMHPLIAPGDTVTLGLMNADGLRKGDIFAFIWD